MDTRNQKLKSLCAHSIAASVKSFDWQCSEWTLWWWRPLIGQIISQSAKNSRRHLILSVLRGKSACRNIIPTAFLYVTEYISVCIYFTQGKMWRVVSIQPLKMRCFYKQRGQPTWVQTRQETFEMPRKELKTRLWDLTSQPAGGEVICSFSLTNPIYLGKNIWQHSSLRSVIS